LRAAIEWSSDPFVVHSATYALIEINSPIALRADLTRYGEQPSADAVVEIPPGELDHLQMNRQELSLAASATQGGFYTLATADQIVDDIPAVPTMSISSGRPPYLIWNHAIVFCLVMLLLTSEWLLRKRKHLL